jgi:hypothetical protein
MNDPLESTMCDARWRRLVAVELIVLGFLLNRDTVDLMLALRGATEPLGWRLVVLAVQLAAIAGGLALLWQPGRRTRLRLAVAATALLLCAVFNVLFVQFFYRLPEKRAGWISHVPVEERNEFGFRGQPVDNGDGDFVILLVGDSQVEAVAVPLERMPERLLEAHLRELGRPARVFTLGARGYGQDQQLLMLEKYFEQRRADLILLWFTPGNDVWNNLFPTHWPANGQPKPTFWLENGGLRGPNHALGELLDPSRLWPCGNGRSPAASRSRTMPGKPACPRLTRRCPNTTARCGTTGNDSSPPSLRTKTSPPRRATSRST